MRVFACVLYVFLYWQELKQKEKAERTARTLKAEAQQNSIKDEIAKQVPQDDRPPGRDGAPVF